MKNKVLYFSLLYSCDILGGSFGTEIILKKGSFCQYHCSERGIYLKIAKRVVNSDENISFDTTDLVYFSFSLFVICQLVLFTLT